MDRNEGQLDRFVDMIDGEVDVEAERASMAVAHQVAHAVDALIQTPAPAETSAPSTIEPLSYVDDRVVAVVAPDVVELAGMRQVRLVEAADEPLGATASDLAAGTEVRFEIDLAESGKGPMLAGRLFRKDDGLPIVRAA